MKRSQFVASTLVGAENSFIEDVAVRTDPDYHAANFYDAMKQGDAFASLGL